MVEMNYPGEASNGIERPEKILFPRTPFKLNIKYYEELLARDTEAHEALTDAQHEVLTKEMHVPIPLLRGHTPPPFFVDAKQPHYEPISSFDMKLPTALTNHSINAHVEKFNVTIPFPGPRKPHKVTTKFTVNGHPVSLEDLVGLNGAIHVVPRLMDPRGHGPHHHLPHPPSHDVYSDQEITWEDWEDWLPQWAAKN